MSSERSDGGAAGRLMELLWRSGEPQRRRGPRPTLSVDDVVAAAIAIADRDGLEAVTMRQLAQSLGVGAMALYTYVPGKVELLSLMLDAVYGEMSRTSWAGGGWRERLTAVAAENRALFEAHPWAAAISTGRPPLGPGLMAKYEHELRALEGAGLDDVEMDAALTFLLDFVRAVALAAHAARGTRSESGMTDEEWWEANAPLLARIVDADDYPTAARVGTAAGAAQGGAYSADHAWEFGLERVLDGLQVLVERRQAGTGAARMPGAGGGPSAGEF